MVLIALFATALFRMAKSGHTHQAKFATAPVKLSALEKLFYLSIQKLHTYIINYIGKEKLKHCTFSYIIYQYKAPRL